MSNLFSAVGSKRSSFSRAFFTTLSLALLVTACKKDKLEDGGGNNPPQQEQGYFPTNTGKVWNYRTEDADGVTTHTLSVASSKDSAGGKVVYYQSVYSDGTSLNPYVFYTNNQTVYAHTLPNGMQELLDELKAEPTVSDVVMEGVPMLQRMPRNPQVNDAVTFSDPFHLGYTVTDEGEQYSFDLYFQFSNGKVVGFEDVTTPAGTFKNALKWQYNGTLTFDGPFGTQEEESSAVLWFAKGIGVVKSVETNDDGTTTTTVLQSVTNK